MTRKPELCAGCGTELGPARLVVTADTTGGPTGQFHTWPDCYGKARQRETGLEGPARPESEALALRNGSREELGTKPAIGAWRGS